MKTLWIDKEFAYDGTQLKGLYSYLGHGILGDSVVSWIGPCNVTPENMLDGEDLLAGSEIRGSKMLHFIFEIFDRELTVGVCLQRIFANICKDLIEEKAKVRLFKDGDDLYWDQKKLSISIAVKSPQSVLVHFAVNLSNDGTPVPTCSLTEWNIGAKEFAEQAMLRMGKEYLSIIEATWKVRATVSL
jgi:hypothetical protein